MGSTHKVKHINMKLNKKKSTKIIGIKEKTKEWNDQNQSFRHYISESTNNKKKTKNSNKLPLCRSSLNIAADII